jgi:hypothetical protein
MLPTTLSAANPESERRRYAVVRLDTMETLPGLILAANCDTGMCLLRDDKGEAKEHFLGPGGLRIVVTAR